MNASSEAGIGIRILKDQKMVFGSSNELLRSSIKDMVSDLMKKVLFHTRDEFNVIYGKEYGFLEGAWSCFTNLISYDPKITEVPIQEKIKRILIVETSGLNHKPQGNKCDVCYL